jgi:hypothetical protein
MIRYDRQNVFQPGKGFDIVDLAGGQKGIDHGGLLCSFMGTGKQIFFFFPVPPEELSFRSGFCRCGIGLVR